MAAALQRAAPRWPEASQRVPVADRGIFGDLDSRVRLRLPRWLEQGPWLLLQTPRSPLVMVAGVPVGFAPAELARQTPPHWWLRATGTLDPACDRDGDGIADSLDVLIGAKKAVLNGARYVDRYRRIPYPGGDVPRDEGVCTDVIVRAFRNAGIDLQQLVQQDIRRAPRAYPNVRRPNASIDHRRVHTLLPLFQRHFVALPAARDGGGEPLLPGDVLFMDTMRDPRPEHVGIVSDALGPSGLPLVINNWTHGHRTAEMDLLATVPVTHRFRLPCGRLPIDGRARGLPGLLARRQLELADRHRQLVLVTTKQWSDSVGQLRRFVRPARGSGWQQVGRPVRALVGARGLGWGRGLHSTLAGGRPRPGPVKREGDRRSPAGAFLLGTAFGQGRRPHAGRWPWRVVDGRDRLVDDPGSASYNTWQRAPADGGRPLDWRSAEDLSAYRIALVVEHNTRPVVPGAGSAIFVHLDSDPPGPSVGCTTLRRRDLVELLGWLDPAATPALVQVPGVLLD